MCNNSTEEHLKHSILSVSKNIFTGFDTTVFMSVTLVQYITFNSSGETRRGGGAQHSIAFSSGRGGVASQRVIRRGGVVQRGGIRLGLRLRLRLWPLVEWGYITSEDLICFGLRNLGTGISGGHFGDEFKDLMEGLRHPPSHGTDRLLTASILA